MSSSWQSNALNSKPVLEIQNLSSMTTILETSDAPDLSVVYPPFGFDLRDIKSRGYGLSTNLYLDRTSVSSSDSVEGKLEIKCNKGGLKIGKIEIRLVGFEGSYIFELISRNISWKEVWSEKALSEPFVDYSKLKNPSVIRRLSRDA
jgi:hypothetical protein